MYFIRLSIWTDASDGKEYARVCRCDVAVVGVIMVAVAVAVAVEVVVVVAVVIVAREEPQ